MKRAAPDTDADVSSASAPAQRPVTGPAAMIAAIEADDLAAMERCWVPELALEKLPTEQKDTCLTYASRVGSLKAIQWLVRRRNADVDQVTEDIARSTPLYIAAARGRLEIAQFLVCEGKADVNKSCTEGETPLFAAAQENHMEMVKFLVLDGKAEINQACIDGTTPLNIAAQENYVEVVKFLVLDGKADVNKASTDGATPLHVAAQDNCIEVVKFLVLDGKADIN
jgi:ankyrin repeat protein